MGLGHEADPVTRGLKNRGEARPGRALAIGASNQRTPQPAVWLADAIQDRPRSFGPELHPEAAESGYVSEGLWVGHGFCIVQTTASRGVGGPRPRKCCEPAWPGSSGPRRPGSALAIPRRLPLPERGRPPGPRSEEHTSELQSHLNLVCRLLLEKKKTLI